MSPEETSQLKTKMDAAAAEATIAAKEVDPKAFEAIGKWWLAHYRKAGYKRLGRIVVAVAKEGEGMLDPAAKPWEKAGSYNSTHNHRED